MLETIKEEIINNDDHLFKSEPRVNVIGKEEFEERMDKVFHLLWKTLSKSFGPFGAPTLIYNYPYSHVTKDGYTIMKNLSMDASETKVDQAISDMAADICGRLNYAVGDGTTSAIIATNSIYKNYRKSKDYLESRLILPRDIIHSMDGFKNEIINKLQPKVRQIRTEDMTELQKNISDVVWVSSNGDSEMTHNIAKLYSQLGAPGITCSLASDGITKCSLITGYQYNLIINDRLYINTDNNTCEVEEADVIIFDHKVSAKVYKEILKPINTQSKIRGRKLIVCAPSYDEKALQQVIAIDLNNEYQKSHTINMILTTYRAVSRHTRKLVADFSTLMGTTVIDKAVEEMILDKLNSGLDIQQIFHIDTRDDIPNLKCAYIDKDGHGTVAVKDNLSDYDKSQIENFGYKPVSEFYPMITENAIRLGFTRKCSLGLKSSLFTDMYYDENQYKVCLQEAQDEFDEAVKKYEKLGTFNVEVSLCQDRLYALRLKTGQIEVGADSELSQKLLKDAVDDSVKAAASAFYHGVVLGCNTNLLQAIDEVRSEHTDPNEKVLLDILYDGFVDVYKTVLGNAFKDFEVTTTRDNEGCTILKPLIENKTNQNILDVLYSKEHGISEYINSDEDIKGNTIHDILIQTSINHNMVFDISTLEFSNSVINSAQTDEEILKATIDLISLIIVGNQMVVTQKHNF